MEVPPDRRAGPGAGRSWARLLVLGLWVGLALAVARLFVVYGMDRVWRGHEWETVLMRLQARAWPATAWGLVSGVGAALALGRLGLARGVLPAAALLFVGLSGIAWDDHFHVPDVRSDRGRMAMAGLAAVALVGALGLAPLLRRAPRALSGGAAALLVLLLAAVLPPALRRTSGRGELFVLRSSVIDLTRTPERLRVVRQREGDPPRPDVITPTPDWKLDGADLPSLVLPPPAAVELRLEEREGPLTFVAAAGIDQRIRHELRPRELPVTFHFRALRNGEVVFEEAVDYTAHTAREQRVWRPFEVPLVPGDVLRLETDVEGATLTGERSLTVGFGRCSLERRRHVPRQRSSAEAPSIVLIVMDTLRADRMSLYGYERPTTPRLEELAARGVVFDEACAASSWTWPSTASILTGLLPEAHGVRGAGACYLDASLVTLGEVLQARGYTTGGFVGNPLIVSDKGFDQGFEHFSAARGHFLFSDVVVPDVVQWLERNAGTRFFLYAHLVDTHGPYNPLPEHLERFTSGEPVDLPPRALATYRARMREALVEGKRLEDVVPAQHLRWMSDVYDASVATADTWVGRILDRLDALGIADETIVAFTSDHGEELADHDLFSHGHSLHRELVRVPLVIAGPGIPAGARVRTAVSNRHLAPTLARFGGTLLEGLEDAVDLFERGAADARPVYFSTEGGWVAGRAHQALLGWRSADRVLHVHLDEEGSHVLGLYDPAADPGERRDLSGAEPARAREMAEAALRLRRECTSRAPRARAAGAGTLETLRALGYAGDEDG